MPAQFHNDVLDGTLDVLETASALHISSGTPADYTAATGSSLATITLDIGDYTTGDASPDGRGLTVAAQTGVPVTVDGAPTYYCLVDDTGQRLLARTEVDPTSPDLTSGSTVDIPTVVFSVADPIQV